MSTPFAPSSHADSGALPALLERLAVALPHDLIDELWLFPTRRIAGAESTVIVLSLYTDQPDRRRIATVKFRAVRNKRGEATVETDLRDHAIAPADRLTRVIDGVLRRQGDDLSATPPHSARINGEEERWLALIESLAEGVELDVALERVRLRRTRGAGGGGETDTSAAVEDNARSPDRPIAQSTSPPVTQSRVVASEEREE